MGLHEHGESKFEEEHCMDLAVQLYLNEFFPNSYGNMMTKGWSEPAATGAEFRMRPFKLFWG
jgi:hypothetical protein